MSHRLWILPPAFALLLSSCVSGPGSLTGGDSKTVSAVAEKAAQVASLIGGPTGFGGMSMSGYMQAAPSQMGFNSSSDLATPGGMMTVRMHNQAGQACTFHLAYSSSQADPSDQTQDVTVPAGQTGTVQIPCAEIMGLGSLNDSQAVGCTLADGRTFANMMAVPGFLNMDYACGSAYDMYCTPDTADLDGDGDVDEFITMSNAMQTHMQSMSGAMMGGGMMGGSTSGSGMMGGNMMGGNTP
ncbi:MAG: hypothetical protein AMXMBFR13_35440 [Phycisphaerae bacterium]